MQRIQCRSENSKGVYCLQYDDEKIISGLRDNSIKVSTSLCPFSLGVSGVLPWKLPVLPWCIFMGQWLCVCGEGEMAEPGKVLTLLWKLGALPLTPKMWPEISVPPEGEVSVCHWPWLWLFHHQDFASMLILPLASQDLISSWCLVISLFSKKIYIKTSFS